jgi:glycosyltransferase involved in cell wall biosynthesis
MRLVLVSNTYPPRDISGVGALVYELAREAERRGHEVRVLTRAGEAEGDPAVLGVEGRKALFPLLAAGRFARELSRTPPSVVHVHESDGALVALLVRVARWLGQPLGRARVVATLQVSYREERLAVRAVSANGQVVSRPARSEVVFAWLRAPLLAALGRLTAACADAVVAPSRATALELARDYGCVVRAVIPNGVLALAVAPEERGASPAGAVAGPPRVAVAGPLPVEVPAPPVSAAGPLLYVGRLRTRKAVAVLLEALASLAPSRPDLRLVVIGEGEQAEALRLRAGQPDLRGRVEFLGQLSRGAIAEWYRRAAMLCLPSTYEGFPVTIVEAMAAGLPVVATRVAGIPEAVEEGRTGLLVAPEDAVALADAIERLLRSAALRQRMGRAARDEFHRKFAIQVVTEQHLALYRELWNPGYRSTQ